MSAAGSQARNRRDTTGAARRPWPFDVGYVTVEELERRVARWEARYGVPSERLADAFARDGSVVEDDDYLEWSHDWAALQAVRRTMPARR